MSRRRCICCTAYLRSTNTEPACDPCVRAGNYVPKPHATTRVSHDTTDIAERRRIGKEQCAVILNALPGRLHEVAAATGIDNHKVGERLKTLRRQGLVTRSGQPGDRKGGGHLNGYVYSVVVQQEDAA